MGDVHLIETIRGSSFNTQSTGMLLVGTHEENVQIYVNLDLPTGPLDRLVRDWHASGDMSEATSTWLCFQGR